jgi:hypothetical protein
MWGSLGVNVKGLVGAALENVQKLSQDLEAEMNAAVTTELEQNQNKTESSKSSEGIATAAVTDEAMKIESVGHSTGEAEKPIKKNPKKVTQRVFSDEPPSLPTREIEAPLPLPIPPPASESYVLIEKEKESEVASSPQLTSPQNLIENQPPPQKAATADKARPKRIKKIKENPDLNSVKAPSPPVPLPSPAAPLPSPSPPPAPVDEEVVLVDREDEKISPMLSDPQPDQSHTPHDSSINEHTLLSISDSVIIPHKKDPDQESPHPTPEQTTAIPSPDTHKIVQFYESKVEESHKHYFERRIESLSHEISQLTSRNEILEKENQNLNSEFLEKNRLFEIANLKLSSQMKGEMDRLTEVISERERALQSANIQLSELHRQHEEAMGRIASHVTELNESKQQIKQLQNSAMGETECKREIVKLQEILKDKEERLEAYAGEGQALSRKQVCVPLLLSQSLKNWIREKWKRI